MTSYPAYGSGTLPAETASKPNCKTSYPAYGSGTLRNALGKLLQ